MADEFQELDEWMMKAAYREREKKVPQSELDGFQNSVLRRISGRKKEMPWYIAPLAFSLFFALSAGILYYFFRPVSQSQVQGALAGNGSGSGSSSRVSSEPVSQETLRETEEINIAQEIRLLRELGVWTEEDEEAFGIPLETTLDEINDFLPDGQPAITVKTPSAAG